MYVATVGGTATAITLTPTVASTAYVAGQRYRFIAGSASSAATTINVSGLGAKNLFKRGSINPIAGDWGSGMILEVVYDGTSFQLLGADVFSKMGDIASAGTINLDSTTGNVVDVTGTTTITAITLAEGKEVTVRFTGILTLTNGASLVLPGAANITTAAGDFAVFRGYAAGVVRCTSYQALSGRSVISSAQIQPISASVGASALTISASALSLDFRSATLTSGTVTTVSGTPANLVVPSTATLGTGNGQLSRLAVLALNNAGTIELAVVNLNGANDISEQGVISTTAISGAATSPNTVYSTTSRSSVAYRVLGFVESTQATAGTWASAPSLIQGTDNSFAVAKGPVLTASRSFGGATSDTITGIPSWAKKVTINLVGVNGAGGASNWIFSLGSAASGIISTGYSSCAFRSGVAATTDSTCIVTGAPQTGTSIVGQIVLCLQEPTSNVWTWTGMLNYSNANVILMAGSKTLGAGNPLDRIQAASNGGAAGTITGQWNAVYEG
jgi:hypothetical protein